MRLECLFFGLVVFFCGPVEHGLVAVASATSHASRAQAPPTAITHGTIDEYQLSNGLKVILAPDRNVAHVALSVLYRVGSAKDPPNKSGLAHLAEHLMFEGSQHCPQNYHEYLEGVGGTDVNGETSEDRTEFYETLPASQIELALWLESDRMGFIKQGLSAQKLEIEREVIRNEKRQNERGSAGADAVRQSLFPTHPYSKSIIGSHANVESIELSDLVQFYNQYYQPANASLAITGNFDPTQIKSLIEKYFDSLPSTASSPISPTPDLVEHKSERLTVHDTVAAPQLLMAWVGPAPLSDNYAAAIVTAKIYQRALYSYLAREKLVQHVSIVCRPQKLCSVFQIKIDAVDKNNNLEKLERELVSHLEALFTERPEHGEREGAINTSCTALLQKFETLGGSTGRAQALNHYEYFVGKPDFVSEEASKYKKLTDDDLAEFAEKYLRGKPHAIVTVLPGVSDRADALSETSSDGSAIANSSVADQHSWRSKCPEMSDANTFVFPEIHTRVLANGLTVRVVERRTNPLVTFELSLNNLQRLPSVPGMSRLVAMNSSKRLKDRFKFRWNNESYRVGELPYYRADNESIRLGGTVLSSDLEVAIAESSDGYLNPTLQSSDIDITRAKMIFAITEASASIGKDHAYQRLLFEPRNLYSTSSLGSTASVQSLTREQVQSFSKAALSPHNASLAIVGDVAPEIAFALAEKYFGSWRDKDSSASVSNAVTKNPVIASGRRLYVIDKPDKSQTQICVSGLGPQHLDKDFIPVTVANCALGVMSSARLDQYLRRRNGYTYHASSTFYAYYHDGSFLRVDASVQGEKTAESIDGLCAAVNGVREQGLTSDELRKASAFLQNGCKSTFDTTSSAASGLNFLSRFNLTENYYEILSNQYGAVTLADVQHAAQKYFDTSKMVIVLVGDKKKFESELKNANWELVEIDRDGDPITAKL